MTEADRPQRMHGTPPSGQDITVCCGYGPSELPRGDRMTTDMNLVTCGQDGSEDTEGT